MLSSLAQCGHDPGTHVPTINPGHDRLSPAHRSDWDSSDATYSPLLSSDTGDPGSASAGSGGIAGAGLVSGRGFAGSVATGSAVAADSAGLGEQYAADRAGSFAADQRGGAGAGGGRFDVATGGAQANGASADDQCALLSIHALGARARRGYALLQACQYFLLHSG